MLFNESENAINSICACNIYDFTISSYISIFYVYMKDIITYKIRFKQLHYSQENINLSCE